MSNIAIRTENLGKRYRIGQYVGYGTFLEAFVNAVSSPFRRLRTARKGSSLENEDTGYIWALRDISLEIKAGEALGIIGSNGAGKTTLLKILSRITEPTSGMAEIHGRVGSLLEVGSGFHPELTGRENIYLNGAILGMRKKETDRKFDEIVDFSGVEKFIDTPLKRFSSGMRVRLAFAVAAYLEPDILLVDEVLAVGDAAFQKKCLGKMGDVAGEGRTVLFVSHNMGAINGLCERVIHLENGTLKADGPAYEIVQSYLSEGLEEGYAKLEPDSSMDAQFLSIAVMDESGDTRRTFDFNERVRLNIELEVRRKIPSLYLTVSVHTILGIPVMFSERTDDIAQRLAAPGRYNITVFLPRSLLAPNEYLINLGIGSLTEQRVIHNTKSIISFQIMPLKGHRSKIPAIILADFDYEVQEC